MKFQIIAGDLPKDTIYREGSGNPAIVTGGMSPKLTYLKGNVRSVEVINEQNQGKILRTAGWGLVGYAVLGPLGSLAGMLGTRTKNEICFACYLKDGQKFMAIADTKIYQQLMGLAFESPASFIPASEPLPELQAAKPLGIPAAFCTQCGAARPQGARFCGACGSPFQSDAPAPRALSAPPVPEPSATPNRFVIDEDVAARKKPSVPQKTCPRCKANINLDAIACRVCHLDFPFSEGPIRAHLVAVRSLAREGLGDDGIALELNKRGLRCLTNGGVWNSEIIRKIRDDWRL